VVGEEQPEDQPKHEQSDVDMGHATTLIGRHGERAAAPEIVALGGDRGG
jgi:hypothetical protein